jgi:hypothetical protein
MATVRFTAENAERRRGTATEVQKKTPDLGGSGVRVFLECVSGVQAPDALSLRALRALGDFKLDFFALRQGLEAFALNAGVVDKDVRPVVLFNEPVTLLIIEPLHFSTSHWYHSLVLPGIPSTGS